MFKLSLQPYSTIDFTLLQRQFIRKLYKQLVQLNIHTTYIIDYAIMGYIYNI